MDHEFSNLLRCLVVVGASGPRLVVAGEIDISNAEHLDRFLDLQVRAAEPGQQIQVDLAGVDFCAAVGVRVLRSAARRAKARRVGLYFDPRSAAVDLALDVCGWPVGTDPAGGCARRLRAVRPSGGQFVPNR